MKQSTKIAFLGGDRSQHTAAAKLCGGIWDIYVCGHEPAQDKNDVTYCDDVYSAIFGAFAVILPLPASTDGIYLNISDGERISLLSLADAIDPSTAVIGGKLPKSFVDHALSKGIECYDYFESEAFQIKNAYTTAEAALSIAMERLDKNVCDARFAITGYGRIAKQLARLLVAMGADVTVCARKESDLVWAELGGCRTLRLGQSNEEALNALCNGYDVIYNTVPRWLFDESFLERVDTKTLLIELASAPGGIDVSAAKKLRSNVLWAASLPGKYAPESAGELIAECVRSLLKSKGGAL